MIRIKPWYQFGRRVWVALGAGWLMAALGAVGVVRLDRAGALLVCAAIVAEVFSKKRHRMFVEQVQAGPKGSQMYVEVDAEDFDRKDIEITYHQSSVGKSTVNTTNWHLYRLARDSEFLPHGDTRIWDLERTTKRLEMTVDAWIVISAIAGTLLWAFG